MNRSSLNLVKFKYTIISVGKSLQILFSFRLIIGTVQRSLDFKTFMLPHQYPVAFERFPLLAPHHLLQRHVPE